MNKRFRVREAFNGYVLEDLVTGRKAYTGDGTGIDFGDGVTYGTEGFAEAWEEEINSHGGEDYFDAYFPSLYDLKIYDNPQCMDRYVVILQEASPLEKSLHCCEDLHHCLGLSIYPDSPQGFSQWGTADPTYMAAMHGRVHFLDLPENVQAHLARKLEE